MAHLCGGCVNELASRSSFVGGTPHALQKVRAARRNCTLQGEAQNLLRQLSHRAASTSAREPVSKSRSRTARVHAALFEPPPFEPSKLSIHYMPGATPQGPLPPSPRFYTLTHNDITGALQLSIGPRINKAQVHGFYTRLLRDEVLAEWVWTGGQPQLHIHCHVSGEEKWLAPPQLRNYVFRREMTLVLDTLCYAERELLASNPHLEQAKVYIHFQSHKQDLDLVEAWGVLGSRATWQRMPSQLLERMKLLIFGFPANPQQRQRRPELFGASIQWRQQQQEQWERQEQQQQQQGPGGLVAQPAVALVRVEGEGENSLLLQEQEQQQLEERIRSSLGACTSTETSELGGSSSSSSMRVEGAGAVNGVSRRRKDRESHDGQQSWQQQQQQFWCDEPGGSGEPVRPTQGFLPSPAAAAGEAEVPVLVETLQISAAATADGSALIAAVADADAPSVVVLGSSRREGGSSVVPLVGGLAQQSAARDLEGSELGAVESGGISEVEVQRQWQQLQQKRLQQKQAVRVPVAATGGPEGRCNTIEGEEDAGAESCGGVGIRHPAAVPATVVAVTSSTTTAWTAASGLYGWRSSR